MERIVAARSLVNHRLWLPFTDGAEEEVDLAHLMGRDVFARWNDQAEFAFVRSQSQAGMICWPRDIDL